jgi:hypothetical protein
MRIIAVCPAMRSHLKYDEIPVLGTAYRDGHDATREDKAVVYRHLKKYVYSVRACRIKLFTTVAR